jgi:hypothetical protein
MAAYGDYNDLCPMQTFTEAEMRKNFPNSRRAPWTLISEFGPTPSGCEGFTAIVPESAFARERSCSAVFQR